MDPDLPITGSGMVLRSLIRLTKRSSIQPLSLASKQPMDSGGPQWTTAGRRFVPSHLNPGTSRSSFAKPFREAARPGSTSAGSTSAPAHPSSFGTAKSRAAKSAASVTIEDDLPPTQSIQITRVGQHQPLTAASTVAPSTPKRSQPPPTTAVPVNQDSYSVVVFGFPPGMSQLVLQHFSRFGDIVENTPHTGDSPSTSMRRPPAIDCGRNWLRIAYHDRAAAQRALAENGHVMPGQFVIGCVPGSPSTEGTGDASMLLPSATNSLLADDSDRSFLSEISFNPDESGNATAAAPDSTDASGGLSANITSSKLVKPAPASLFRPTSAHKPSAAAVAPIATVPEPKREAPATWTGWALQKARESVFGWDDL